MQHTLVAVFDNRSDAQKALEDLVASGFARTAARLSEDDSSLGTTTTADTASEDTSIGASIRNFFADVFGSERDRDIDLYSNAVNRGHFALTLQADSLPEVERAADIVERYGPIDIDEKSQEWGMGGYTGDTLRSSAGSMSQSQSVARQSSQQGAVQGVQPGASQQRAEAAADTSRAIPVIQEEPAVGKREVQRGGARIYQRLVETPVNETVDLREQHISGTGRRTEVEDGQLTPEDDHYYRSHWSSNYAADGGGYDDYGPAYQYGSTMRRSDSNRGRSWDEVEPALRSDWEARNPGSTWERIKAAVRHGWDRLTS